MATCNEVTLNQETTPAVRLLRWRSEPELVAVPVPEPGPGEVLLKVEAAGLCHSDLHLMEWPAGTVPYTLPFTLGHETAGTVAALGAGTKGVREGDRVLVYARWGCGVCWPCLQGAENLCETPAGNLGGHGGGVGRDGGLAEHMVVPSARYLVPIRDLVALARTGAVRTQVECFTLGEAADAYRRLRRGEVRGRAVVTPDAGYAPDVVSAGGYAHRENYRNGGA
jgi:D-arabinose 1-dehydrogenase-like Zn-dependent alcohol dehydrogenase